MDGSDTGLSAEAPYEIIEPPPETGADLLPLVLASPHSGTLYPPDLVAASRLDALGLRRSEDSFVDELFRPAAARAPLLRARFARAYLDLNREPFELDPGMFEDSLPHFANTRSPRVEAGLGTLARVVANGENIYARRLTWADAEQRIERIYRPYHRALRRLVEAARARFGGVLLLDCHSMPSGVERGRATRVDVVLGDCHGTACAAELVDAAHRHLVAKGYRVARNAPYAGGFTTSHYGAPDDGSHALQIELNRALYMDERSYRKKLAFEALAADMTELTVVLGTRLAGLLEAAASPAARRRLGARG